MMHKCFSIMYMIKSEFHRQITLLMCPEIFCRGGRKRKGDEKKSEKRYSFKLHGPSTTWYLISG